jgi:hypothetical protein
MNLGLGVGSETKKLLRSSYAASFLLKLMGRKSEAA